jgi:hypothetical protein
MPYCAHIDVWLDHKELEHLESQAREAGLDLYDYFRLVLRQAANRPPLPTHIHFEAITMAPTEAGQTQIFTGTLAPAGSAFPTDTVFSVTSNDSAVSPSADAAGLVVSVTYPDGWTESSSTPLTFSYAASSASNPTWSLSATITPSAPPPPAAVLPTSITFTQTS